MCLIASFDREPDVARVALVLTDREGDNLELTVKIHDLVEHPR
jgi:hypothetical protein